MKPAARKGDYHACADTGPNQGANLQIIEGSPNIFINGRPAARVGDTVDCRLSSGASPVIAEGAKSVFFNGLQAARMGDRIENGGSVSVGSGNVFIGDDEGCLITIGDGVKVEFGDGCNVYLNCKGPTDEASEAIIAKAMVMASEAQATAKRLWGIEVNNPIDTTTPSVTSVSSSNQSSPVIVKCQEDVSISPTSATLSESDKQDKQNKQNNDDNYVYYMVTSEGFKDKLTTVKFWEDINGIKITDYFDEERWVEDPEEGGISKVGRAKTATTTVALSLVPAAYTDGLRYDLIGRLKQLNPQVEAKISNNNGVLLQGIYSVVSDGDNTAISLKEIDIIYNGADYKPFLKKWLSEPSIAIAPSSALESIYYLFIWAVKE